MSKVWLLVLGLGSLAVLIGVASAYVYSQSMVMPWGSPAVGGTCTGCYGGMHGMMGPMHNHYGWEDGRSTYSEDNNLTPSVEITFYTNFENGRFLFKNEAGEANPTITVKTGDIVKITLINADGVTHNIAIPDLGVYSSTVSSKGASTSIIFEAEEPGEYRYFCTVPGHKEAGMLGKLIIVDA